MLNCWNFMSHFIVQAMNYFISENVAIIGYWPVRLIFPRLLVKRRRYLLQRGVTSTARQSHESVANLR